MIKRVSLWIIVIFYCLAGINHFIQPEFYYALIPPYFSNFQVINAISGLVEIVLAMGLLFSITRKFAAWGIVLMLIAFIPSHVYFIQIGSCIEDGLCVSPVIGWLRLVVIHPLLIVWAWWHHH